MKLEELRSILGQTDIYLIDQILKGRYSVGDKILDAGCGNGRNLPWFLSQNFKIFGIDQDKDAILSIHKQFPKVSSSFCTGMLSDIPFAADFFDHIISSAVLHFAYDEAHFDQLFAEHIRVLTPGGTFFIRMTSSIGLSNDQVLQVANGVFKIPDGSTRFLISREMISSLIQRFALMPLEPIKTTNVQDKRFMTTLLFRKG